MKTENTNKWGGVRSGAGRKRNGKVYKNITIAGTDKEVSNIKSQAKENKKSISRFIIEKVVPENIWKKDTDK